MRTQKTALFITAVATLSLAGMTGFTAAAPKEGFRGGEADVKVQRDGGNRGDDTTVRGRNNGAFDGRKRGAEVERRNRDRDRGWQGPGHRDRIRKGQRYSWGPGVAFYFSDGYYYGECGWLKRRAIETGSRTWWRRYERCRDFN